MTTNTTIIDNIKAHTNPAQELEWHLQRELVAEADALAGLADMLDLEETERISKIERTQAFAFKTGELVLRVRRNGWCTYR